jgi:hypothetical protein
MSILALILDQPTPPPLRQNFAPAAAGESARARGIQRRWGRSRQGHTGKAKGTRVPCASALLAVPPEVWSKGTASIGYYAAAFVAIENPHITGCTQGMGLALVALAGYRVLGARVGRPSCTCALSRLPKKRRVTPSARRFLFPAALWVTKETCGACLRHWIARAVLRIGIMARENAW